VNNLPRQKLCEIITQYGRSVYEDPQQCKGLLLDLCGDYKREVNVLITVLEERVVADLLSVSESVPQEVVLARLTRRVCENRGLAEDAARWGVESWALALGRRREEHARQAEEERLRDMSSPRMLPPTELARPSTAPPVAAQPALPAAKPLQRGISRRTVVVGLAGLAVVGVAGDRLLWLTHAQPSTHVQSSTPTQPPQTPTPTPTPTVVPPNPAINSSGAMFGFDLARTHFYPDEHTLSPANVSRLAPYWTATVGDRIYSSPAVANGVVYIGSADSKMYAFNADTGKTLWSTATTATGNGIESSPVVANGVVYIGSLDDTLYAFDAATGQLLWSAATGFEIYSSPTVANGVVYVGSKDRKLYAFHLP
jgi:hypothetical protein